MEGKLRTDRVLVVEGKYDKIKVEALVEATVLTTGGFRIFRDKEMQELFRTLAQERGLVILTDPDRAGFQIRAFLRSLCGPQRVTDVYVPDFFGKESRKPKPSREGKLGVEGVGLEALRQAFERAGICSGGAAPAGEPLTKARLYADGLSGGKDSACLRRQLCRELKLPERLSANSLLTVLNACVSREDYRAALARVKGENI